MELADTEATTQIMASFGALAPLFRTQDKSLKLSPNPRQTKARRKDEHSSPDEEMDQLPDGPHQPTMRLLSTLAQLALRHDQELQSLRKMDQFILFLSPEQMGALHIMIQETAQWKSKMEAQNQGHLMPLRQHLMLALLNSLRTRAGQIVESKETDQLYDMSLKKGVILADRSFPYHRWDPATQKLVLDKKPPISFKKMEQHLDELQEMMQEKELIARFHALRGFNASSQNAVPWRLQIHMRRDRAYELLYQLSHNSVWMAVGASMKPHMGQSPLATALQAMTQEQKTKPKGKGKGKHKATKQEP